jgi:alanine racemase
MVRPTYVEIDLGAIAHNVTALEELIAPSRVCTVVKADGYGHGDVPVANVALDAGSASLAVALVEEGVRLREAGIAAPILLLSEPSPEDAGEIARWELTPTVYSLPFVTALADTKEKHDLHLKVDTGMHRVGATPHRVNELVAAIEREPNLTIAAIWTHFAVADQDPEYTRIQIEMFDEVVAGFDVETSHLANTAGAILFPEARRSLCRIGLGTYGLHPCPETFEEVELRPAMRLVSHISHVQRLGAGERPSYGRAAPLERAANVITAPVGYADGFARALSRRGTVLVGGRRHRLAGTVTMDQIVVNVGDHEYDVGEEVVLLGTQGEVEITAYEWAEELGTISYEVVSSIGPRVPRRYK